MVVGGAVGGNAGGAVGGAAGEAQEVDLPATAGPSGAEDSGCVGPAN